MDAFNYENFYKPIASLFDKCCYKKIVKLLKDNYHIVVVDQKNVITYNTVSDQKNVLCNYYQGRITDSSDLSHYYKTNESRYTADKLYASMLVNGGTIIVYRYDTIIPISICE